MRGWAKNTAGHNKKEKKKLILMIDDPDKRAESRILSDQELNQKHYLNERLVHLLRKEEIKWYDRAKTKDLLESDDNTQYFHLVANGKHRKQRIFKLELEEGVIVGDAELKAYITNYYKGLFGPPENNNFSTVENKNDDIPHVIVKDRNGPPEGGVNGSP